MQFARKATSVVVSAYTLLNLSLKNSSASVVQAVLKTYLKLQTVKALTIGMFKVAASCSGCGDTYKRNGAYTTNYMHTLITMYKALCTVTWFVNITVTTSN